MLEASEPHEQAPQHPVFDKVVNRAVEIFHRDDFGETRYSRYVMDGSYAWADALHELIETDEDALALTTENC